MFNPEKLLHKVIAEMADSHPHTTGGKKYKKKKKKKRKAKGFSDTLVSNLSSGKGLMTAIALGVGAYTIVKGNKSSTTTATSSGFIPPTPAPASAPVPPPIPGQSPPPSAAPSPAAPLSPSDNSRQDTLATRLIQVMIAAAWADGEIDPAEETRILNRLQEQQLDSEEKQFLLNELHAPKSITQLTQAVNDPRIAQTMYSLAVATLVIDTEAERNWLDQLAKELSISKKMQNFIEEEL